MFCFQAQNSISFKDFCNSASGSIQFNFIGPTNITAVQCDDRTGCACGYWKVLSTTIKPNRLIEIKTQAVIVVLILSQNDFHLLIKNFETPFNPSN